MCAQQRLKSACASAQSDQCLHCPHDVILHPCEDFVQTAQADLNLRWAQMSEGTFSDDEDHLTFCAILLSGDERVS